MLGLVKALRDVVKLRKARMLWLVGDPPVWADFMLQALLAVPQSHATEVLRLRSLEDVESARGWRLKPVTLVVDPAEALENRWKDLPSCLDRMDRLIVVERRSVPKLVLDQTFDDALVIDVGELNPDTQAFDRLVELLAERVERKIDPAGTDLLRWRLGTDQTMIPCELAKLALVDPGPVLQQAVLEHGLSTTAEATAGLAVDVLSDLKADRATVCTLWFGLSQRPDALLHAVGLLSSRLREILVLQAAGTNASGGPAKKRLPGWRAEASHRLGQRIGMRRGPVVEALITLELAARASNRPQILAGTAALMLALC